jgi:hypothetical protein
MEQPTGYSGLKPTKLTKKEFEKKYRSIKSRILEKQPEIKSKSQIVNQMVLREMKEFPFWNEKGEPIKKGGTGYQFYYMSGGVARPASKRIASQRAAKKQRTKNLKLSNEHLSKDQLNRTKDLQSALNKLGFQADHKLEVQTTGPMVEQLRRELKLGLLTKKEYNNELLKLRRRGIGDDPKNFQKLTGKENSAKRSEVEKKNKALQKLEKTKLSDRYAKKGMNYKLLFDLKRKAGVANDDFRLNTKGPKLDTGRPKLSDFLPQPVDNVAGFGLV